MKKIISNIPTILVAEPEETIRVSIEMILIEEGYDCHAVSHPQSLLRAVEAYNSDLIIADVDILYDYIEEVLSLQSRSHNSEPPGFLVILSYEQVQDMLYLMQFGITEYLIKPFRFEEMTNRIRHMLGDHTQSHH
ncbi:response regulator transcription factor [Fodinibius salsisoli]|uniref:Response regulator transcription factor n=1 Tax=Fodinibius salsisoli TaxID=2820877 RepID=A0ABT3PMX8_9BACT|nr:response regulator [Fodinibius salsisoli]MCW9707297.1 response regulator transcription factor [Fodinibius salsisoli]